jgi:hypothetical protein
MAICDYCGSPIEFRYIDGRCVPIHLSGGCTFGGTSPMVDFSGCRDSKESCCHETQCPICGSDVFFIRHNGGSVWLDPPLGPPWCKHPCFDDETQREGLRSLVAEYKVNFPLADNTSQNEVLLGVVVFTAVAEGKAYTKIRFEAGEFRLNLDIKYNAGFLLGELCVLDVKARRIWPISEPKYLFLVTAMEYETP